MCGKKILHLSLTKSIGGIAAFQKNLFNNTCSAIMGILASFLLSKMSTAYCMIVIGITFTILFVITYNYMKNRVGLEPEEYSEEERKYDELK